MTDVEMRAVEQIVVDRAQRLIVVLATVHAARAAAIQHLTLDDLDLPNRRIAIAVRPSSPPVVAAVVDGRPGALRHRLIAAHPAAADPARYYHWPSHDHGRRGPSLGR